MPGRLALLAVLLGAASAARAASLQVVPVIVELTAGTPRATLVVRNLEDAPLRLELTVSAWAQAADGQMRLAPAPEVVVYPPLLEIAPRGERKVRISTTAAFGPGEQSYRLFIRELPDAQRPQEKNVVRLLTRIGVPVFLLPDRAALRAEIAGIALRAGHLVFSVKNTGNVHLRPVKVEVKGLDAAGAPAFSASLDAWYVLAGGERTFDFQVPADGCLRTRTIAVEMPVGDGVVSARVESPGGACGP